MKYTVKININKQINVNEGKTDENNNSLPVDLKVFPLTKTVTDITSTGATQLTVSEIKAEIQKIYPVTPSMDEKLSANGDEFTNPTDVVTARKLEYSVTESYVAPDPTK
jgi:hypothetical protein